MLRNNAIKKIKKLYMCVAWHTFLSSLALCVTTIFMIKKMEKLIDVSFYVIFSNLNLEKSLKIITEDPLNQIRRGKGGI
jgi:hypothetical protein